MKDIVLGFAFKVRRTLTRRTANNNPMTSPPAPQKRSRIQLDEKYICNNLKINSGALKLRTIAARIKASCHHLMVILMDCISIFISGLLVDSFQVRCPLKCNR